ncbi:unnamed protein product, partial [Staurois parvus]
DWYLWGEQIPEINRYLLPLQLRSPKRSEVKVVLSLPSPQSSGTRDRSQKTTGHSQSAALLMHVQWAPGCEAASGHSRVPTLKMPMPGREDGR